MKKIAGILMIITGLTASAQVSFTVSNGNAIAITPDKTTGLETVFVIDNSAGDATISYTATSASSTVTWEQWSSQGGAYATPVSGLSHPGSVWSITAPAADTGFTITENGRSRMFWVVNYANHYLDLQELTVEADNADFCNSTTLQFHGNASPIRYFTINGRPLELSRDLKLRFLTQEYSEASGDFTTVTKEESIASTGSTLHAPAPLCATTFTLSGDRFLREWGKEQEVESRMVNAMAVDGHTSATQADRDVDNEQKEEAALGGSAPVDITFTAAVSEGALFHQWEFARDPEFGITDLTFSDLEVSHTFQDAGTTYVRFVAANADGSCEYVSDTYEVFVGQSALLCPNAFSPGSTPGVNDEWKVSYKSIVSFSCAIFNRWGIKITSFDNPAHGWDGKYKGKLVPSGVYYYVIQARGADGKEYNLSGDINIINSSSTQTAGGGDSGL